jgi:hypothetical protein
MVIIENTRIYRSSFQSATKLYRPKFYEGGRTRGMSQLSRMLVTRFYRRQKEVKDLVAHMLHGLSEMLFDSSYSLNSDCIQISR